MNCTGTPDCECGCCAGTSVQTPAPETNAPGLSAIADRVGTWSSFKESMLARLSSSDYPALQQLKTRSDDDFTIALLDASAMMLDVLTFYQERLANESYLRTGVQLRSLTELSRLIGYQPAPGVSAEAYLAFSLRQTPGQPPDPSAPPITIPKGTQVQSVPAQGQSPQTFETSADILAKPDWSALQVQTGRAWGPPGGSGVYLSGTSTQLQLGDSLLILGVAREDWIRRRIRFRRRGAGGQTDTSDSAAREQWQVVVLNTVQTDKLRNITYVGWDQTLAHEGEPVPPAQSTSAKVFAFRQKAAPFGHNAPNPSLFVSARDSKKSSIPALIDVTKTPWQWIWNNFQIPSGGPLYLDATYQKVVVGSWLALVTGSAAQLTAQLFKVDQAKAVSLAQYTLSSKVTQVETDYWNSSISNDFPLQQTEVWCQSDELQVAEQPLTYPLYGAAVQLESARSDLTGLQVIAVTGTRQKIAIKDGVSSLQFTPSSGNPRTLAPGDVLTLTDPTPLPPADKDSFPDWSASTAQVILTVADAHGHAGTVTSALDNFVLAPSDKNDPVVSECAIVTGIDTTSDAAHTRLQLKAPLANCYDRTTTTVNANVGLATNGASVSEIMGSGSSPTRNQGFALRQKPLTYDQAPNATGRASTLSVSVNGVAWRQVPTLYGQSPASGVYAVLDQVGGATEVRFGDGVEGALLPTGTNNVQANYRIGSGAAGNVGAGALTTLIDRPLGVSGVVNPQAATGGQDPQSVADVRVNAPRTVLTLGRAVSITDYEDIANSFPGIAKAHALWIPSGPGRGVFLTVAGPGGTPLPSGNPTLANLIAALHDCGNPLVPITAVTFVETLFGFSAALAYHSGHDKSIVKAQVRRTLSDAFGFDARSFGQSVGVDEIEAAIQRVPGIRGVNVTGLTRLAASTGGNLSHRAAYSTTTFLDLWRRLDIKLVRPFGDTPDRLTAYLPVADVNALPQPAELVVLDPDPGAVKLGVLS